MAGTLHELSKRRLTVNHLRNGNFLKVPRQFTYMFDWQGETGETRVLKTIHRYDTDQTPPEKKEVTGFGVPSTADPENFIAYWDVWGAAGVVGFNQGVVSLDGGNVVNIVFVEDGAIYFKQSFDDIDKFLGHTITMALSGYRGTGTVKIQMSYDVGTTQIESRSYFSRYFGSYFRMVHNADIPLDATKLDVVVKLEGVAGNAVSISGACLALGSYLADLPYSDNIADVVIPSGTVILYTGESCPAGWRAIAEDHYLMSTFGDPNAFRGNDRTAPEKGEEIGENFHDHGKTSDAEIEPTAFEASTDTFDTPPIEANGLKTTLTRHVDQDYAGPKNLILPPLHSHLLSVSGEDIQPPYLKAKICEKI